MNVLNQLCFYFLKEKVDQKQELNSIKILFPNFSGNSKVFKKINSPLSVLNK